MTYSLDLINRAINYYKNTSKSLRKVADIFSIPKSSLHEWIYNLPLKYTNNKTQTYKIKDKYLKFIKNSLDHNPCQTQDNLVDKLNNKFNQSFTRYHINIILKIIGYTKKKLQRKLYYKDLKELKTKQKIFKKEAKKLDKDKTICIDEVGVNKDTFSKYGYCHSSKRLKYFIDANELPKKRSIIVAISNNKVIHYKIITNGNANKKIFIEFMKELVLKVNNKIYLMDNVRFHRNDIIKKIVKDNQSELLFIPPYSPQFNPIEEVFSLFKSYLRKSLNIITKYLKLDFHIKKFFDTASNFECYYKHSFD